MKIKFNCDNLSCMNWLLMILFLIPINAWAQSDEEALERGNSFVQLLVAEDFDVMDAAGGTNGAVVKEYMGVKAKEILALELVPHAAEPEANEAPIINFIEIIREDARATAALKNRHS